MYLDTKQALYSRLTVMLYSGTFAQIVLLGSKVK